LQQFQELYWRSEAEGVIAPLTPRETEILNYIAKGYLNKQIAAELDISEQTIKNHVTSILRKLNANARTEAVVVAIKVTHHPNQSYATSFVAIFGNPPPLSSLEYLVTSPPVSPSP